MSKIALVALDLNMQHAGDSNYKQFYAQPPEQQIDAIAARIQAVCEELKTTEPDSMWIVSFHENMVKNQDGSAAVPFEIREYYQEALKKLAQTYPNLTIVAGPITTKKHVDNVKKIDKLLRHYALHSWIKEQEHKSPENEKKDLSLMIEEENKLLALKESSLESGLDVICNTCYVVSGEQVWRHDKISPFNETSPGIAYEVFQPAKVSNINSLITLTHPITKEPIDIAIEICREHANGVFAKTNPDAYPLLHLVLSNTIALLPQHLRGNYVLQLDAINKPRLILRDGKGSELHSVNLYQTNMLDKPYSLVGPLEELYPFAMQVRDKFMQFINAHPQDENSKTIQALFEKFSVEAYVQALSKKHGSNAHLSLALSNMMKIFTSNLIKKYGTNFLKQESYLVLWINEMQAIINAERRNNLLHVDYVTTRDALLRDKTGYFEDFLRTENFERALQYIDQYDVLQKRQLTIREAALLIGYLFDHSFPESEKEEYYRKIFANLKDSIMEPLSFEPFSGMTFFHALCQRDMTSLVKAALPYCTNINAPAENGDTPLHVAVRGGASHELLKMLFEHGADARERNLARETQISLAEKHHPTEARYIDNYPLDEDDLIEFDLDTTDTNLFFNKLVEKKLHPSEPLENLDDKKPRNN